MKIGDTVKWSQRAFDITAQQGRVPDGAADARGIVRDVKDISGLGTEVLVQWPDGSGWQVSTSVEVA